MEKDNTKEMLVNGMGSLFTEIEIEARIAESVGISREELNKKIENDEEMPECIMKYGEINRQRRLFEERLLTDELKEKGEHISKPSILYVVFSYYPQFEEHYEILKSNGYITEIENGLKWGSSKQALAEYFGNLSIPLKRKTRPWKDIEILFGESDLKNSFSSNGNPFKNPQSDGYTKLLEILQ
jgi:hypothetical protein